MKLWFIYICSLYFKKEKGISRLTTKLSLLFLIFRYKRINIRKVSGKAKRREFVTFSVVIFHIISSILSSKSLKIRTDGAYTELRSSVSWNFLTRGNASVCIAEDSQIIFFYRQHDFLINGAITSKKQTNKVLFEKKKEVPTMKRMVEIGRLSTEETAAAASSLTSADLSPWGGAIFTGNSFENFFRLRNWESKW